MPIKFSFKKLPVDAYGKAYDSLEAFQQSALAKALGMPDAPDYDRICHSIVKNKDMVIEILELTMDARPAARGVPKKRKPKTPEPPQLPNMEAA